MLTAGTTKTNKTGESGGRASGYAAASAASTASSVSAFQHRNDSLYTTAGYGSPSGKSMKRQKNAKVSDV